LDIFVDQHFLLIFLVCCKERDKRSAADQQKQQLSVFDLSYNEPYNEPYNTVRFKISTIISFVSEFFVQILRVFPFHQIGVENCR
jgi:hypothetical protein